MTVALSLTHDDGTSTRHLLANVTLPGAPSAGDRVRAGRAGMFLVVESVLWDDHDYAMVTLAPVRERDAHLHDLLDRGWRIASQTRLSHGGVTSPRSSPGTRAP
jgi:hypothetical protein